MKSKLFSRHVIPALEQEKASCLVIGGGVSGVASARLLDALGASVVLIDASPLENLKEATASLRSTRVVVRGGVSDFPGGTFDLCVVSPSIPAGHPWLQACAERGIPVIAEMELGYAFWPGRILAVTGSKGKSSVVKLCAETLTRAGHPAAPCGNYGTPLSELVLDKPSLEWAVAETSSFQLEHVKAYHPDAAILLNLQADHLNRHGSFEEYAAMKFRLFQAQGPDDAAFLPDVMDFHGQNLPSNVPVYRFGLSESASWLYRPARVTGVFKGKRVDFDLTGSWFDNPILGEAAAAVCGALSFCGLTPREISAGLKAYKPLPHRMQIVADENNIKYVDDSKATSLAATEAAIRMIGGPIRLIAGGRFKERDPYFLKDLLSKFVKKVYLIGECAGTFFEAWHDVVPCIDCGTLGNAVEQASADALEGETVLLSPGCASFDQFASYGERGDRFTHLILSKEKASSRG